MATLIKPESRQQLMGHKPGVVWLTGLSGAGKSTIAFELELQLHLTGVHTCVLDGDNLRHGINADLGFTPADRTRNVLRTAQVARLMADAGLLTIVAMISPFSKDRLHARELLLPTPFLEVHVQAPLEMCEARDPKGLYQKARQGLLLNFTGIGSPYEAPSNPDLLLNTSTQSLQNCIDLLMNKLKASGLIPSRD
ncbi:MAG: adenylyl-sulfate kinase [Limnobacter sp.]|nr:adenylyl-sulfate kinase [Limnobacter sp.]